MISWASRRSSSSCPSRPGVYLFKDATGAILYVGKARVLRDRVRSYFQASRPFELHKSRMVEEIADLELVVTDTEMEALALENNLIKRHKPRYNVLLRDDKNHPYLKLTLAEEYPRLLRGAAARGGRQRLRRSRTFPPASGRKTARRSCTSCSASAPARRPSTASGPRPCLQYQIKRCIAPCVAEVCCLERYRRACEDAAALPRGPDRRGGGAAARRDGRRRGTTSASRRRPACATRCATLERLETPQKITTTDLEERDLFGVSRRGRAGGAPGVLGARREGGGARGLPARRPHRARDACSRLGDAAVLRRRAATCPASCSWREAIADRELLEAWLAERARDAACGSASRSAARSCACWSSWCATRASPSTSSGSTRGSSPRRSCAPCGTSSTWRWSRAASSASTSRTSRARTSWPRWSCFEDGLPKKSDYRKFRVKSVTRGARRLRVDARGGGAALQAAARGGQGPARPRADRRRQGPARRRACRPSTSWAWATSRWPAWPSARS